MDGFVKPLGKKGGDGVRPISLFETLLEVATGLALDAHKKQIIKAVGDFQYGAMLTSGADKMIYNLRALSKAKPHFAFVTTDIENAFGNVPRRLSLAALRNAVPGLAPIMALLWRNGSTRVLVPRNANSFAVFDVTKERSDYIA